jgi:hypothetical protein
VELVSPISNFLLSFLFRQIRLRFEIPLKVVLGTSGASAVLATFAPFRRFDKDELKRLSALNQVEIGAAVGGVPFAFGQNYVIFSDDPSSTIIVDEPPLVAFAELPEAEVWRRDRLSRAIFSKTVGEAQKRGVKRSLRLANKSQHPHSPPIRWELSSDALRCWRQDFVSLLIAG